MAIGLFLATATVFFRDIQHIIGIAITAWFFVTPILYPESFVTNLLAHHSKLLWVILANPLSGWFVTYRSIILEGRLPSDPISGPSLAYLVVLTVGVVAGSFLIFNRLRFRFEEEL
jgi:lipopolysaccharide transport system permease protein